MRSINRRTNFIATALSIMVVIVLGSAIFTSAVNAETPFDVTTCFSGERTTVAGSPEVTVAGSLTKGTWLSNHENKIFQNMTSQCAGILKILAGKAYGTAYCKVMNPDGDFIIMENTLEAPEIKFNFLHGTGKWKGIRGSGQGKVLMRPKPITPSAIQNCLRVTGTFELSE